VLFRFLFTLVSDVAKGNFQLTYQQWVGANTDPDFFEYAFSWKRFPPDGANRGHYRNARIDALSDQIRVEMNQGKRKALCSEVQRILADDLPYLPLWFNDVVSVHRARSGNSVCLPRETTTFWRRSSRPETNQGAGPPIPSSPPL
jgi:peptide/nickel transport system substrate-binding protein